VKIDKYLTRGEKVVRNFNLKEFEVKATNKRLFVTSFDGNLVQDYAYQHISSMKFAAKYYRWLIGVGIAIIAASLLFKLSTRTPFALNFDLFWIGIGIGIACVLAGLFLKKEVLTLYVIGVPHHPEFQAERKELEALFKTIRDEKESAESVAPEMVES
jgi:hypothetical protein